MASPHLDDRHSPAQENPEELTGTPYQGAGAVSNLEALSGKTPEGSSSIQDEHRASFRLVQSG